MIFFVANDGTIIKSEPSPVYQGGANSNAVYVVAPFAADSAVTVAFTLPNGEVLQPRAMTPVGRIDGVINKATGMPYSGWLFNLPGNVTRYFGTVTAQFDFYSVANQKVITASSSTSFTVGRGVPTELPQTPTEDVYTDILGLLAALQSQLNNGVFTARSIYPWNATYTYGINEIVFYPALGELGALVKSVKSDNENNPPYNAAGQLNTEFWEKIADFNELRAALDTVADATAQAQAAAASAATAKTQSDNAAASASEAENTLNETIRQGDEIVTEATRQAAAALSSAQSAEEAAQRAEEYAKVGIKLSFEYSSVDDLPIPPPDNQTIYMIPNGNEGNNVYDEYVWAPDQNKYEKIGTTDIDLSAYLTKIEAADTYVTKETFDTTVTDINDEISDIKTAAAQNKVYDVVIRTQAEFDTLISSATWGGAQSVLFVGNGGTLEFETDNAITIPASVHNIAGINDAVISSASFGYATQPTSNDYTLEGLTFNCKYGIANCINIKDCIIDLFNSSSAGSATSGVKNCRNVVNCKSTAKNSSPFSTARAYDNCENLVNCYGTASGTDGQTIFYNCSYGVNCDGDTESGAVLLKDCSFWSQQVGTFADTPLSVIIDIANRGQGQAYFNVGDEKEIRLTSGATAKLVIADFNHDVLSNGKRYANMTLCLKISGSYRFSSANISSDAQALIPGELLSNIATVKKASLTGTTSQAVGSFNGTVFSFSKSEIDGSTALPYSLEGKQYELWKTTAPDGGCWTRSYYYGIANSAWQTQTGGGFQGAYYTTGNAPYLAVFCLGQSLEDVPEPFVIDEAETFLAAHPVGSSYENNVDGTSPAELYGGTWEAETAGRTTVAAGTGYAVNSTGGSADAVIVEHSHTLVGSGGDSVNSMLESANDTIAAYKTGNNDLSYSLYKAPDTAWKGKSGGAGVSGAGKNMPPYRAAYKWWRTA